MQSVRTCFVKFFYVLLIVCLAHAQEHNFTNTENGPSEFKPFGYDENNTTHFIPPSCAIWHPIDKQDIIINLDLNSLVVVISDSTNNEKGIAHLNNTDAEELKTFFHLLDHNIHSSRTPVNCTVFKHKSKPNLPIKLAYLLSPYPHEIKEFQDEKSLIIQDGKDFSFHFAPAGDTTIDSLLDSFPNSPTKCLYPPSKTLHDLVLLNNFPLVLKNEPTDAWGEDIPDMATFETGDDCLTHQTQNVLQTGENHFLNLKQETDHSDLSEGEIPDMEDFVSPSIEESSVDAKNPPQKEFQNITYDSEKPTPEPSSPSFIYSFFSMLKFW